MLNNEVTDDLEITADGFENSKRKVVLLKVKKSYILFKELVDYYAAEQVLKFIAANKLKATADLLAQLPKKQKRAAWVNMGGQLVPAAELDKLKQRIVTGKIKNWDAVHAFY